MQFFLTVSKFHLLSYTKVATADSALVCNETYTCHMQYTLWRQESLISTLQEKTSMHTVFFIMPLRSWKLVMFW